MTESEEIIHLASAAEAEERRVNTVVPTRETFIRAAIVAQLVERYERDGIAVDAVSLTALIANTFTPDIDGETLTDECLVLIKRARTEVGRG